MTAKRSKLDEAALRRLGKNLRHLRVDLDVAQDTLARDVGMSKSHYSAIELGEVNPSLLVLLRICRQTDTPLPKLLEGVE